jgi:hypothetical protein
MTAVVVGLGGFSKTTLLSVFANLGLGSRLPQMLPVHGYVDGGRKFD